MYFVLDTSENDCFISKRLRQHWLHTVRAEVDVFNDVDRWEEVDQKTWDLNTMIRLIYFGKLNNILTYNLRFEMDFVGDERCCGRGGRSRRPRSGGSNPFYSKDDISRR
jgi:hypothetical protein